MTELFEAVLAVIIVLFGFKMLAFAAGITKTHPVAFLGKVIGGLLVGALRLPVLLLSGVASSIFRRRRRRRRLR